MDAMSLPVIFQRSLQLLQRNVILLVPGLIAGFVNLFVQEIFLSQSRSGTSFFGSLGLMLTRGMLCFVISYFVTMVALVAMTGMAGRAWENGKTGLDDGLRIFRESGSAIALTLSQLTGLMVAAIILAIPTCSISLCAAVYLLVYVPASAVIGRRAGLEAIRESVTTAKQNIKRTTCLVSSSFLLLLLCALVGLLIGGIPLIGKLAGVVCFQVALAYLTLVVVGEYINVQRVG